MTREEYEQKIQDMLAGGAGPTALQQLRDQFAADTVSGESSPGMTPIPPKPDWLGGVPSNLGDMMSTAAEIAPKVRQQPAELGLIPKKAPIRAVGAALENTGLGAAKLGMQGATALGGLFRDPEDTARTYSQIEDLFSQKSPPPKPSQKIASAIDTSNPSHVDPNLQDQEILQTQDFGPQVKDEAEVGIVSPNKVEPPPETSGEPGPPEIKGPSYSDKLAEAIMAQAQAQRRAGFAQEMAIAGKNLATTGAGIRAKHLPEFGAPGAAAGVEAAKTELAGVQSTEMNDPSSEMSKMVAQSVENSITALKGKLVGKASAAQLYQQMPLLKEQIGGEAREKVAEERGRIAEQNKQVGRKDKQQQAVFQASNQFAQQKDVSALRIASQGLKVARKAVDERTTEGDNFAIMESIRSAGVNRLNEREISLFLDRPGVRNIWDRVSRKLTGVLPDRQRDELRNILDHVQERNNADLRDAAQASAHRWAAQMPDLGLDEKELADQLLYAEEKSQGPATAKTYKVGDVYNGRKVIAVDPNNPSRIQLE